MSGALHLLSYDPCASRLFSARTLEEVGLLTDWVCEHDPYGELPRLRAALRLIDPADDEPRGHVGHQLWCAWRQASWTAGTARPLPAAVVSGKQWLDETRGHPTVLVAPMTMPTADALHTLAAVFADRPAVALGEDDVPRHGADIRVVNGDAGSIRHVLGSLAAGGTLCTYADFVYAGRDAETMTLFGRPRPVSSGFVTLASRPGTMLLPTLMGLSDCGQVTMEFDEPLLVQGMPAEARAARGFVRELVARLVEGLIRRDPRRWLLLPTLNFESPQLART